MPDITISELVDLVEGKLNAEMRVHRIEVESALRDVQAEVADGRVEHRRQHRELVELVANLTKTVNTQAETVNDLAATRATWTTRVQIVTRCGRWLFNSAPGQMTTVVTTAGAIAGAIAFF